jgi:hypothetical protein
MCMCVYTAGLAAHGCIVCLLPRGQASFAKVRDLLTEFTSFQTDELALCPGAVVLLGNKHDLRSAAAVTDEEAQVGGPFAAGVTGCVEWCRLRQLASRGPPCTHQCWLPRIAVPV